MLPVKIKILHRINDIETDQPKDDCDPENQRRQQALAERQQGEQLHHRAALHSDPCTDGASANATPSQMCV